MKKTLFSIIIFLFITGKLFTQNYYPLLPSNTIWNVIITNNDLNPHPAWHFRYGFIGDTLINDTVYTKIYTLINDTNLILTNTGFQTSQSDTNRYQNLLGFVREDTNKHIFFRDTLNTEMLLYDFSKTVGDTLTMKNYQFMDGHLTFYGNYIKVITDTDSVLLGNNYRKRYYFDNGIYNSWIEGIGIGNSYGLLAPIIPLCTCGDSYTLACLKQNDTILILDNPLCSHCFCSLYTSITKSEIKNNFSIFVNPNPLTENTLISIIPQPNTFSIEIYNCNGQKVFVKSDIKDNNYSFDKGNLQNGLYLLKILINNKIISQKKIVIQ